MSSQQRVTKEMGIPVLATAMSGLAVVCAIAAIVLMFMAGQGAKQDYASDLNVIFSNLKNASSSLTDYHESVQQSQAKLKSAVQRNKQNIDGALKNTTVDYSTSKKISEASESILKDVNQSASNSTSGFSAIKSNQDKVKSSIADLKTKLDAPAKSSSNDVFKFAAVGSVILAVILFFVAYISSRSAIGNTGRMLAQTNNQIRRNQKDINELLETIAALADGDLTVKTMGVRGEFTDTIADALDSTIYNLRSTVSIINKTAEQVTIAAQDTSRTAVDLAEATEHQAKEIAAASASINEMASSIDQVSTNATESASVAERSVSIANKGAEVVQNTIHGMDNIREQIQETSKRIKRLGESSQEIGDIVSLIDDIADQTNILALNAAIQASMAGEAGRGFAVVADEVQRLAERASAATKQIESLVKTIQTDTNEAVISMEHTTAEVVRGARLAQNAGVALEEIENVSTNLADLIQNISNAARQQSSSAGHISNTMNVIQGITTQTSSGTKATARAISELSEHAVRMRNKVSTFKMPEQY